MPPSKKYLYLGHKHSQWPFEIFPIPSLKLFLLFCSRHITAQNAIRKCSRYKCQLEVHIYQSYNPFWMRKRTRIFQKPISLKWVSPNSSCTHSAMWNESVNHERSDMVPAYKYPKHIGAIYLMTSWGTGEHFSYYNKLSLIQKSSVLFVNYSQAKTSMNFCLQWASSFQNQC